MTIHEKKSKRLRPVIDMRQKKFDVESELVFQIRRGIAETTAAMNSKQHEYLAGVDRLNRERGSSDRLMLDALENGLDSIKSKWVALYESVLDLQRQEKLQMIALNLAHKDLEAIKSLQNKYTTEHHRELNRRDQIATDEHALRKYSRS